jgi:pimeloyl-ACP methyl ester carboxylesterase
MIRRVIAAAAVAVGPFLALAAVLLAVGLLLCAAIVILLARSLVTPPRMTDGKATWVLQRLSPGDLGLNFEDVSFELRDIATAAPLRIAAWWIPHPAAGERCVVFLHGYADAKVGAIAWAPTWHALGWNVLALDLRAHGESGGRYCTGGYFERHDVNDVINLLRAARPAETRHLALFGLSFGAAVAVAAAAERTDLDAVVLDSPVPDFAEAAMAQMERAGAPGGLLRRLAVRVAERMTGASFADVRMLDLLPKVTCPVLAIAPANDPLLANGVGDRLRAALPASGVFWQVGEAHHLLALPADPDEYGRQLSQFLTATVATQAVPTH